MTDPTRALTLQLLQSLAERPRPYTEVLEAWRTSCSGKMRASTGWWTVRPGRHQSSIL